MYYFGAYVNLVDGDIWDVEAAGSSPAAPIFCNSSLKGKRRAPLKNKYSKLLVRVQPVALPQYVSAV